MTTRANTTARGYGSQHQKLRAQIARLVAAGTAVCWRCGRAIEPWMSWDLGHDDYDRSIYRGPEHQRCNRAAAARLGNRMRGKRAKVRRRVLNTSRDW
jgi:hypothetical protein